MKQQDNICRHFGVCGGCDLQNVEYSKQLENKQKFIAELLKDFEIETLNNIVPSVDIWYYRNKMEFVVGKDKAKNIVAGLREKNKFYKIVDLAECKISLKEVGEILNIVKQWVKENNIEPYDLITHQGKIRYVVIRHSKNTNQLMLNFVITGTKYQFENNEQSLFLELLEGLKKFENLNSVYVSINNKVSDNAVAEELIKIYKEDFILEVVNGVKYKIYPSVFFQPNTKTAELLYDIILDEVCEGNVMDIYCGSGGISLQLIRNNNIEKIIGVDSSKDNIAIAKANCELNNISEDKVEFVCDNAEVFLAKLWKSKFISNLSTVIVDPPRPGLSKKVKGILSDIGVNRIIYVSCNPAVLKEDLKTFIKFYKIKKVIPVDMFPHTKHIEVVCVLEHR